VVENDVGGRPEAVYPEKNGKIPEVAKVNNDQFFLSLNQSSKMTK
jgi:hypothetical protein